MSSIITAAPVQTIAYIRRSTDNRQQYSVEAQEAYIKAFCESHGILLIATFVETASGKTMDRPEWNKALAAARSLKCPIIVKSLSRLGRDAAGVIATLNTEKVIVADRGLECDRLTLNLLAVIDQNERERISERTKAGLARAKANGVVLGNPRPREAGLKSGQVTKQKANEFALKMEKIIGPMLQSGMSSYAIAEALNQSGISTQRGGKWYTKTVRNIIDRIEKIKNSLD